LRLSGRVPRRQYEREIAPRGLLRALFQKSLRILARFCIPPGARLALYRMMGISIGRHVFAGLDTWLDDRFPELIRIEDDATLSVRVMMIVHDDARPMDRTGPVAADGTVAPVVLERGCDLGAGAILLPGVTVGQRAVMGADAVVTRDVPPGRVVAGVPARVIEEAD